MHVTLTQIFNNYDGQLPDDQYAELYYQQQGALFDEQQKHNPR